MLGGMKEIQNNYVFLFDKIKLYMVVMGYWS